MGAPLSGKSLGNFEGSTGNATTEFCVISSDSGRRIGDRMTFRESARDTDPGATAVAPGGLIADEPETPGALGEEAEETPRPEPLEAGASPRGEDPVRLYLKEIGKVPLLTAAQEVQIGRRIEVGQIALRRTLAGIPMAVEALLEVGDKLRRGEIPADDVIVLAEGGELDANELRPVLLAFGRLRRLQRKIALLQDKRRSKASRVTRAKAIAVARDTIQKVVADMPLKPALIDDLVAQVRRRRERVNQPAGEARRNRTAGGRELSERSEERRVGKECRHRGPRDHYKKKASQPHCPRSQPSPHALHTA